MDIVIRHRTTAAVSPALRRFSGVKPQHATGLLLCGLLVLVLTGCPEQANIRTELAKPYAGKTVDKLQDDSLQVAEAVGMVPLPGHPLHVPSSGTSTTIGYDPTLVSWEDYQLSLNQPTMRERLIRYAQDYFIPLEYETLMNNSQGITAQSSKGHGRPTISNKSRGITAQSSKGHGRPIPLSLFTPCEIAQNETATPLLDQQLRKDIYISILKDIMLATDVDMGERSETLDRIHNGFETTEGTSGGETLVDIYTWMCRPVIHNKSTRFLKAIPDDIKHGTEILGKAAAVSKLSESAIDIIVLLAINKQCVADRATSIKIALDKYSYIDPALEAAYEPARVEAMNVVNSALAACWQVIQEQYVNPSGAADILDAATLLAEFTKMFASGVKPFIPAGYKHLMIGVATSAGKAAKLSSSTAAAWMPILLSVQVIWDDYMTTQYNLRRAALCGTLLNTVLNPDYLDDAVPAGEQRQIAYGCACYCGYISANIMHDLLSDTISDLINFNINHFHVVTLLRQCAQQVIDKDIAQYQRDEGNLHAENEVKFLEAAGDFLRPVPIQESPPRLQAVEFGESLLVTGFNP